MDLHWSYKTKPALRGSPRYP